MFKQCSYGARVFRSSQELKKLAQEVIECVSVFLSGPPPTEGSATLCCQHFGREFFQRALLNGYA